MPFTFGWLEVHAVDHCNNVCAHCNNHSQHAPERSYQASEYIPWLEDMSGRGLRFKTLSIMGGEPFLHPDLDGFVLELGSRFDLPMVLTTNGFWMNEETVTAHDAMFERLTRLFISFYPTVVNKVLGGEERASKLASMIAERHPRLDVDIRRPTTFYEHRFSAEPMEVDAYCPAADCTALLADGRVSRCGLAAHARHNPGVSEAFLAEDDIFYDLSDPEAGDFWHWRYKWPLKACAYCTHFKRKIVPWKVEPGLGGRLRAHP